MTNKKIEPIEVTALPNPDEICLLTPLYKKIKLNDEHNDWLTHLEDYRGSLNIYCRECERHTDFIGSRFPPMRATREQRPRTIRDNRNFTIELSCPRNGEHNAMFVFRIYNGMLEKIGQSPSIAEIATRDIKAYLPILRKERLNEFSLGIELAAHGVGAGSILYLRRIFEYLVEEAKTQAIKDGNWNNDSAKNTHMDEQILSLKGYLPEFLVENRATYGIMSHGLHTLSEGDCRDMFPLIKISIELILDEMLEKRNKEGKINTARNDISKLIGKLKNRNAVSK